MGLLNKIKGILFDEIEEEEIESTKKKDVKSVQKPIAEKIEPQKKENIVTELPKAEPAKKEEAPELLSERERLLYEYLINW